MFAPRSTSTSSSSASSPSSSSRPTFSSWQAARDRGKEQFQAGDYVGALASFRAALEEFQPGAVDQQLLLSNVVACHLQLGDARTAVLDAQRCITLNPSWSKGHVRLASAYSMLGQSNDACNALQTALRCDPGNRVARQMLVQELGRDRHYSQQQQQQQQQQPMNSLDETTTTENTNHSTNPPPPAQNPEYREAARPQSSSGERPTRATEEPYPRNDSPPQDQPYSQPQRPPSNNNNTNNNDIDDTVTFAERLQFHWQKYKFWYDSLSDDRRTALHVILGLLVLYVAFGGRFGWEGHHRSTTKGNYGANNVYEEYRRTSSQNYYGTKDRNPSRTNGDTTNSYANSWGYSGKHYSPSDPPRTGTDDTTNSYANSWGYSRGSDASYNSGSSSDGGDGFFLYMALAAGALYVAHVMGLSPWQIMLLLNMAGARRRRYGGGGMMYGGGGGFGRPRGRAHYDRRW